MGCLCPKKERTPTNNLNEKLNEEPETLKTEDPESQITIGLAEQNNLPRKRELAKFLLNSDLNVYKKHLPEVLKLNDEDFNELFEGNTKHKFNVQNEKEFKQLVYKFYENKELLEEFVNNKEYYGYILQIWRPNILYKLKETNTEEEKNEIYNKFGIKPKTWDEKFIMTFNIIIERKNPINAAAERMKYYMEANYGDFDKLIGTVKKCDKTVKEKDKSRCNRVLDVNLDTSINKLIKSFIPKFWSEKDKIIDEFKKKEEENAINKIKNVVIFEETQNQLIEKVKEIYGKNKKESKKKSLLEFGFNQEFEELKDLASKFNEGQYEDFFIFDEEDEGNGELVFEKTKFTEKAKIAFSNEMVKSAILGLSVANLSYSIMHLTKTFTQYDSFNKQFKEKLNEIKERFERHQKNVKVISEDVDEAIKQIVDNGKEINQDLVDVEKLIEDITNAKRDIENEKNNSILNTIGSAAGIFVNLLAATVTEGTDSAEYAAGSLANICSLICNATDINEQKKLIKEFETTLNEAKELRGKIQNELDRLRKKFEELKNKHY